MLVSFDIKCIRRDQKQGRNGEACRASPTCFWSSLIKLVSKDTDMVFLIIMHLYKILRREERQRSEKQMLNCPNLLTLRMRYDVNR